MSRSLLALPAIVVALAAAPPAHAAAPPRAAVPEPCPPEVAAATCGRVTVPLDRRDPAAGTTGIFFERFAHSASGPARSTILANFGGPGGAASSLWFAPPFWFGDALAHHDVLLVDDRGTGHSGALDCPAVQHGTASLLEGTAACADQLGARALDYSSAEIAADDEAVRAALGIDALDFAGTSFGGIDAIAYATRYPRHLRSVVLDTAVTPRFLADPIATAGASVRMEVERVGLLCSRSPACGRSYGRAVATVRWLVDRVRRAPVSGVGLDADGGEHRITIDAQYLLVHLLDSPGGRFMTPAEVPAAAQALAHGDAVPLLRLGAEGFFPEPGDAGDPEQFSQGAFSATQCVDEQWPWSPGAALGQRQAQWAQAVARTPDRLFAPFRPAEIEFSIFGNADFCLPWPGTGTRPAVEPGARYPDVPVLAVAGELDALPFIREGAAEFPHATFVRIEGTGHNAFSWGPCARQLYETFLDRLSVPDTSCAGHSPSDYPGVRAFPRVAAESPAAVARRGDTTSGLARRVAHVAVDAALDALKRSQFDGGDGPGLRGGSFHAEFADSETISLAAARWTTDVAVDGTLHWSFADGSLDASLTVDGPGALDGELHVHGGWLVPGSPRTLEITGRLAGHPLVAAMPSG